MIDDAVARRYLLGNATEGERATIEEEYFRNSESSDRIAQVEEDLIEDYLTDRLPPRERGTFERVYLATPQHRIRVETMRRLTRPANARRSRRPAWLALAAAAAIVIVSGAVWLLIANRQPAPTSAGRQPAPASDVAQSAPPMETVARIPPTIFAISLAPLNVRGAGGIPTYRIPGGAVTVMLQLEGEMTNGAIKNRRVAVETMEGRTVWNGAAAAVGAGGILARAEVPSADLKPGDYIVRLLEADGSGASHERGRYVLRIRN